MNRGYRRLLAAIALLVLTAGALVAASPWINRPWAYDVNSSPEAAIAFAAAALVIAGLLVRVAVGRVAQKAIRRARLRRFLRVAAVFAAGLATAVTVWVTSLEPRMTAKRWGVVTRGAVYRSGQISKQMLEPTLRKHEISVVIDLSGFDRADPDQAYEVATLPRLGIEIHRFQLNGDGTGRIELYVQAIQTIEECRRAGRKVLVHCAAGSQRTGGVVAAYRLLVQRESPKTVLNELRRYGSTVGEGPVLLDFLNSNIDELACRLQELGVIDDVPEPMPVLTAAL